MQPVLYAERGYGAPLKVTTMRLFPSLDAALKWVVSKYHISPTERDDLISSYIHSFWVCETPGEVMKKIKDRDIENSATYKALV